MQPRNRSSDHVEHINDPEYLRHAAGPAPEGPPIPPLSQPIAGMPGPVWSMVGWSSLGSLLLLTAIVLPLVHPPEFPIPLAVGAGLLAAAALVGIVGRSRIPTWWLYVTVVGWIVITCWLITGATHEETGVLLYGFIICAVYVGYWFPRAHVYAFVVGWTAATLVVMVPKGSFEHIAITWVAAITISALLAVFLNTLNRFVQRQAVRDPLTGLLNRAGLGSVLEPLDPAAVADLSPLFVIVIDLDGFKAVNDDLGHAAGDQVLVDVAHLLRGRLRSRDIVCRAGGDEFLVLLPTTSDEDAVSVIARAVEVFPIGCSYGVAEWVSGRTFDDTVATADRLMYEHKSSGSSGGAGGAVDPPRPSVAPER
jgi:diguanylate cyclase (GGDEF)-like protein